MSRRISKAEVGITSGIGLIACGPFIFLLIFLLLSLLFILPLTLIGLGAPNWLWWIVAVVAGVITVSWFVSTSKNNAKKRIEDETIRRAELQRAKRELEDKDA